MSDDVNYINLDRLRTFLQEVKRLIPTNYATKAELEDKANDSNVVHKSGNETVAGNKTFSNSPTVTRQGVGTVGYNVKLAFKRGEEISATNHSTFRIVDIDNEIVSEVCTENYQDGKVAQILNVRNTNNDGSQVQSGISHLLNKSGEQDWFYPTISGKTHLGTSSFKWATFNGLNPGALSFPGKYSSSMVVDTTNFATDGTTNVFTPQLDGWLTVRARKTGFTSIAIRDVTTAIGNCISTNDLAVTSDFLETSLPVRAGDTVNINVSITSGNWYVILVPCQGNV